jgi:membrane-associated phospholipid phosphatase
MAWHPVEGCSPESVAAGRAAPPGVSHVTRAYATRRVAALADGRRYRVERVAGIAFIGMLHTAAYGAVNVISANVPPSRLRDFTLPLDAWVPYLPWTTALYYLGDLYIVLWASALLWRLERRSFRRAAAAYTLMILAGATVQVLLPARAPWPDDPAALHDFMHRLMHLGEYAVLPSMHVALCVLPAGVAITTLRSPLLKALSTTAAALVSVSTLTAGQHNVLDVLAGAALALACWLFWRAGRRGMRAERGHPIRIHETVSGGTNEGTRAGLRRDGAHRH